MTYTFNANLHQCWCRPSLLSYSLLEVKRACIYQTCISLKSRMIFVCSGCTQSIGTTWHYQASRTSLMSHLVINLPQIGAAPYQHWGKTLSLQRHGVPENCIAVAKNGQIGYCCDQSVPDLNCPKTVSKLLPSCHQAVGCHQPAKVIDLINVLRCPKKILIWKTHQPVWTTLVCLLVIDKARRQWLEQELSWRRSVTTKK